MKVSAPSSRTIFSLLLSLWQVGYTAIRTFGWDAIHAGVIDLRPVGRGLRLLALATLTLIVLFLVSTLSGDTLRLNGPLTLLENDSTATRALLVPALAVPLSIIGLVLSWSLLLAGAATARPALRYPTLLIYLVVAVLPLSANLQPQLVGVWPLALAALSILTLIALYFLQPWLGWTPLTRWSVFVLLHGGVLLLALHGATVMEERYSAPMQATMTGTLIQSQYFFIVPFLVIAGIGWADFGLELSSWVAQAARQHALGITLTVLLVGFLAFRLFGAVRAAANEPTGAAWAGAALLLAGIGAILWLRRGPSHRIPRAAIIALAVLLPATQLVVFVGIQLATAILLLSPFTLDVNAQSTALARYSITISNVAADFQPLHVVLAGLGLALYAWRRKQRSLTTFGLVIAWLLLINWLTRDDRPLSAIAFEYAQIDQLLLLMLSGLTGYWLVRRQLTNERALRLLALAVLFALFSQPEFLDNPFSPLFGYAGIAFLVFGIVWTVLTAGGTFVNRDTPGLNRPGRLLMYLGYVLLSVVVVHWYVTSHNLGMQIAQANINELGFSTVGMALLYLALAERGTTLVGGTEFPAT